MFASIGSTIEYFLSFYKDFFMYHWKHMTPDKYAIILLSVLVLGWLLMKSDIKNPGS